MLGYLVYTIFIPICVVSALCIIGSLANTLEAKDDHEIEKSFRFAFIWYLLIVVNMLPVSRYFGWI